MKLVWAPITGDRLEELPAQRVGWIRDDAGRVLAVVTTPYLARPLAACLDLLTDGKGPRARLDRATASLARRLAERLGVEPERMKEALHWAVRRAGVEIVPDEVWVEIERGF